MSDQRCESTCNPFVAPCGARFCSYDEMAHHASDCTAPKAEPAIALQARCQALEAELDELAQEKHAWHVNYHNEANRRLASEAQLSALQAVLAEIEQRWRTFAAELTETDGYGTNYLCQRDVSRLLMCADRLAGLRGIRQTEDRTVEKTDHAR